VAVVAAALALVGMALLAGSWLAGGRSRSFPTYERLTYRRGFISNARFAPDGQTILFSADWDGEPSRIFSTRPDGKDSTMLPLPSALLLSVSSRGEMAILLEPKADYNLYFRSGTLALVPLSGGSPREVLRQVTLADWGPDGRDLAVVRQAGGRQRLEYPPGQLLYESPAWIVSPRVSPKGDRVAFYDGLPFNGYSLTVVDTQKRKTVLGPVRPDFWASEWSPDGEEIWFPASVSGEGVDTPIMAADLSGRERLLERAPLTADLTDVSDDGRALISVFSWEESTFGVLAGQATVSRLVGRTDLRLTGISADGQLLALREILVRGAPGVWIARGNGSPPIRLGDGIAQGLSPDSSWMLASQQGRLVALPTGVGEPRVVSEGAFETIQWAGYFRDGKRTVVSGRERGGKSGIFVVDPDEKQPRRIAPEGFELAYAGNAVSPDGLFVAARSPENQIMLCPVDGRAPRPIPGLLGRYEPIEWTPDGKSLFVFRLGDFPVNVERVEVESGRSTLWKQVVPPDSAGMTLRSIAMTPDAKSYAYSCQQYLSTLYLVENLESWRRPTFWSRLFGRRG
jgi:Tol biopolymer transport system component